MVVNSRKANGSARIVFAIESSCDETAISLVQGFIDYDEIKLQQLSILSHVVESQNESHAPFGGVVPEVAARDHLAKIHTLAERAISEAGIQKTEINCVAATFGPGLIGALMVGVLYAQGAAMALNVPLFAVNHVDAHLAPALLLNSFSPAHDCKKELDLRHIEYPALALTVSGGHCHLSHLSSYFDRQIIGATLDDACGEAFDKIAKLLGFPYPGGPYVEQAAKKVTSSRFRFPSTLQDKSQKLNFSFSGLKTAVLEVVRKETKQFTGKVNGSGLDDELKSEIAFAFQEAAIHQLLDRMRNALGNANSAYKTIVVAGGVAANMRFRQGVESLGYPVAFAPLSLCSDNATMIALHALMWPNKGELAQPFARYREGYPAYEKR